MSATTSSMTGCRYGVARVCRIWGTPRSTYYAQTSWGAMGGATPVARRGPKPKMADEALVAAVRHDLERSPFVGEGHRKVHARLRVMDGIRVSRTRVLRLMREHNLLSPHRARKADQRRHEGTIITAEPNVMWGTDGAKVFTLADGWVWVFSTVEHWNAECVGWHVCKHGTRFNALEAVKTGIEKHFGSATGDAARGLSLRMDHGSQYLSDHFREQLRYWGVAPSWAFVEQPQTNGVVERFNRTLKEQAIYGRAFRNVEEVREAVRAFVERYNEQWLIEKTGFTSPNQARRQFDLEPKAA
jgi:putative transposase